MTAAAKSLLTSALALSEEERVMIAEGCSKAFQTITTTLMMKSSSRNSGVGALK